jgi:hypothetical protein
MWKNYYYGKITHIVINNNYKDIIPIKKGDDVEGRILLKSNSLLAFYYQNKCFHIEIDYWIFLFKNHIIDFYVLKPYLLPI